MRRATTLLIVVAGMVAGVLAGTAEMARAQNIVSYACRDGSTFNAAFFTGERRVFLQLDGHALTLPQRLAASGKRYAKDGVTFRVKGDNATIKRGGRTTDCAPIQ
jgi:membrane-bound inhibitor of C-type lysozyme